MLENSTCRIKDVVQYCTFYASKTALKVVFNMRVLKHVQFSAQTSSASYKITPKKCVYESLY